MNTDIRVPRSEYEAHIFAALVPIPLKNRIYCIYVYMFQGGHGKIHVDDDHCGSSQSIPCGETLKIIAVLWRTELEFIFLAVGEQK